MSETKLNDLGITLDQDELDALRKVTDRVKKLNEIKLNLMIVI